MKLLRVATLADERLLKHLGEASQPLRLSGLDLQLHSEGLPDWWTKRGNAYYGKVPLPEGVIQRDPSLPPPTNCVLILGAEDAAPQTVYLSGDEALLVIGRGCKLSGAVVSCGHQSTIILGDRVVSNGGALVSARDGGLVKVGAQGQWAGCVRIQAHDEYAIVDAKTGKAAAEAGFVNLEEKVALGYQAMLLPGSNIGRESVVGARSVVDGPIPANTACWGAPAVVVREGVSWRPE